MKFKRPTASDNEGPQLAPMIDIFFLTLIFFMVASVYSQFERNISIVVPKAASGEDNARYPGEVIINVDKEGKFSINNSDKSLDEIDVILADIASYYTGQPVIIRCDGKAAFSNYVKVFDLCKSHAIENVRIATLGEDQ
ncbi:GTP cyclohydrolase I [Lentisphaera araneosa HTCC2155]|uniref:GTP cyclohydrolase I n=1 Tax=Lentisphaera araneosa HTCC2155 TaxID=313628 RepID=A6DSQ2_9BACT|nr:biopolymer transporter ExbD [Lentisphaera araneosa]EDM25305.1 GTP cyclohydrolase I [Lentisphaera araneosa HTCC2155]